MNCLILNVWQKQQKFHRKNILDQFSFLIEIWNES